MNNIKVEIVNTSQGGLKDIDYIVLNGMIIDKCINYNITKDYNEKTKLTLELVCDEFNLICGDSKCEKVITDLEKIKNNIKTKYRKKPVIIEAFQFDGDFKYSNGEYYVPDWAIKAEQSGILYFDGPDLKIKTLEGDMNASVNDFIIKGINGEIYACKPNIFEKTYERIE